MVKFIVKVDWFEMITKVHVQRCIMNFGFVDSGLYKTTTGY